MGPKKYFCPKINILEGNYCILRITMNDRSSKSEKINWVWIEVIRANLFTQLNLYINLYINTDSTGWTDNMGLTLKIRTTWACLFVH